MNIQQGQTVKLLNTHDGDGGWSTAYVESVHGSTYGVRVQGHSLYYVAADKLETLEAKTEGFDIPPCLHDLTLDELPAMHDSGAEMTCPKCGDVTVRW